MEKVAGGGRSAGSSKQQRLVLCAVLALCGAACQSAWAQQAAQASDTLAARARIEQPRVNVQASTLPCFDAQDGGFQAPRVDLTLYPSNRYGVGAMVGMSGFSQGSVPPVSASLQPAHPSVDVGVRFSQRVQSQQIDVMAWRRVNPDEDAYTLVQRQPVYGARVEMDLSSGRKSGFAAEHGFVGFQLESGARISVRRSNGRPMIYYRNTF
jgi:hypothetical protein